MPGPILDSGANSSGTLLSLYQLPEVDSAESELLLIGFTQTRPLSGSCPALTPAGGWSLRKQQTSSFGFGGGGQFRYALSDRSVSSPEEAYADIFSSAGAVHWGAVQVLLRRTGVLVPNNGLGYHETAAADAVTATAVLDAPATAGRVLLAFVTGTTAAGSGTLAEDGIDWPAGWTQILFLRAPLDASGVDDIALAYKIADGGETDIPVTINRHNSISCVVLAGEYPVDPAPAPIDVDAVAWDVYDAAALLGEPIATLEHAKGRYIRSALHDLGEGGFVINRHAAEATEAILAEGNMVKVRIPDCGPNYLDGFFLGPDGDYTLLSPAGGRGREDLTFRGPGPFSYLDRALMTPCAFSLEGTIVDTWAELWESSGVRYPVGSWYDSSDPDYVRVIDQVNRKLYKINQTTRVATVLSGALFTHYAGGLSGDPSDATIYWALEAPWAGGSSAHSFIHKVRKSDNVVLASHDIGTARWTGIKAAATHLWLTNYDDEKIYNKSKTTGATVGSRTITYKGVLQTNPTGVSVNGTKLGYWFNGKARILIADVSTPGTVERVIATTNLAAFGGDWVTVSTEDFLYPITNVVGRTYKYQLTDAIPACAGTDGVFHPVQQTPGALAWRVVVEITHPDRPDQPCPELTYDFTEDADSNGTTWPARTSTEEFTWTVGDRAFSDVLARLIPAGVTFDLDVNTMVLHAYVDANFGTDRTAAAFGTGKVRFEEGVNLAVNADLAKRDNRGQPATDITVAGENGVYGGATLAGRYVREGFMSVGGATTTAVLDAIGSDELARQRLVAEALAFETLWADDELNGGYIPKLHYWKGDLVRVDMDAGEFAYDEEDLRVYGTLISERDGGWRSALDLSSAYKIPPPVSSVPGTGTGSSTSSGGGAAAGSTTTVTQTIPLVVEGLDDTGTTLTSATGNKLRVVGAQVFQETVGVIRMVITAASRLLGLDDVDADDIADKQVIVWDAATGTFVPGNVEDEATAATDISLVLRPDGIGGVEFGPASIAAVNIVADDISNPPTEAELEALIGAPDSTAGIFLVTDTTNDRRYLVTSDGGAWQLLLTLEASTSAQTLRALTSPKAGGWTQIPFPKAIEYNGVVYFGYVNGANGNIEIRTYTLATGVVSPATVMHAALQKDTHAAPAIEIRSDGRIIAAYSAHNDVTHLYTWISTNAEDISAGAETNIDSQFGSDTYTYPALVWRGSTLHLFIRSRSSTTAYLQMSTSTDNGATWAAHTDVFAHTGQFVYWKIRSNGTRIDIAIGSDSNAPAGLGSIYHFYYDGTWRKSDGTSMGSPIFTHTDLTLVYNGATNPAWPLDIILDGSSHPRIVYAVSVSSNTDEAWGYGHWTGSAWATSTIVASVGVGVIDPSPVAALDAFDPTVVYLIRRIGGYHELWKYVTADSGATWDAGTLVASDSGVSHYLYPAAIKDRTSGHPAILVLNGTYSADVDNSLGIVAVGAAGAPSLVNLSRDVRMRGTKADCTSFAAAIEETVTAYATDTGELGIYTNGAWVWIGAFSLTVKDEGGALATGATSLDFVGAGVVASGTGAAKTITIPGSPLTVKDEGSALATAADTLDFVGAGVVASGTGGTKTITIAGGALGSTSTDVAAVGVASSAGAGTTASPITHAHALTYHDEPLTDGASDFIFDGGDIVVVTGVPN